MEAAANAISESSGMRFDGFWSRIEDLEPEDREYALAEASAALAAADAVMFSDEAVERAARESWNAIADGAEEFDQLTRYERDIHTATVRAVIAALKDDNERGGER